MSDVKDKETVEQLAPNELIEANKVKGHKIKRAEEKHVHATLLREEYNRKTGKPLFKPYAQIFDVKEWHNFLEHPNGMTVKSILHLPDGAMSVEQYAAKKKKEAEAAKAKAEKAAKK